MVISSRHVQQADRNRKRSHSDVSTKNQEPNQEDDNKQILVNERGPTNSLHAQNDPPLSKTAHERIKHLEHQLGIHDGELSVFVERVEHLERNVLGSGQSTNGTILRRIKTLECAFYDV